MCWLQQTLELVSFVPAGLFLHVIFTSCPSSSWIAIPFTTWHSSVILSRRALPAPKSTQKKLTPRHRHPREIKQSLPSWVRVPLPRQPVHGHTAAVRLADSWHRMAEWRTQNPSQGADACYLLTYAREREQGGWEMEGKAGHIRGGEGGGC